jgi:hypothetical protein
MSAQKRERDDEERCEEEQQILDYFCRKCKVLSTSCRRNSFLRYSYAAGVLTMKGSRLREYCWMQALTYNFLTACGYGRPELVSLLLERGANAKVVDKDGSTAFHIACANKAFGRDIIPLVAHAEVDICSATSRGAILLKWQRLPKSRER